MRLGDLDALMETIISNDYPVRGVMGSTDRGMFTVGIQQAVDEQPTVETAPVVRGHWESFTTSAFIRMDEDGEPKWADRRFFVHKECGRRSAIKEKYCPDCGSKMDL